MIGSWSGLETTSPVGLMTISDISIYGTFCYIMQVLMLAAAC